MKSLHIIFASLVACLALASPLRAAELPDSVPSADVPTLAADSSIVLPVADSIVSSDSVLVLPDITTAEGRKLARDMKLSLYDYPYSRKLRMEDWRRLAYNSLAFTSAGVVTLAILYTMPEGATAWNKSKLHHHSYWYNYGKHFKDGPVWDKDDFVFNYILHPYGGAVYYMSARSLGFNMLGSLGYSAFVSAVLWEYGIECFMEIPSIQDLFVTPLVGTLVGEGFYQLKRKIVAADYSLWGSPFLGRLVAWFIDPINEFMSLFCGNPWKHYSQRHQPRVTGSFTPVVQKGRMGFSASIVF